MVVKSPERDDMAYFAKENQHNILVVPGSSFACPGYVRIAYCVSYDTIVNSLPGFKAVMEEM